MTCQQSVGLLARYFEENGLLSVCILSREDLAKAVKPPRTLIARFPYGAPLGPPGDEEIQRGVLTEALALLSEVDETAILRQSGYRWRGSASTR